MPLIVKLQLKIIIKNNYQLIILLEEYIVIIIKDLESLILKKLEIKHQIIVIKILLMRYFINLNLKVI